MFQGNNIKKDLSHLAEINKAFLKRKRIIKEELKFIIKKKIN